MTDLYKTGIRPAVDDWLVKESRKVRDYGDYWSASSAGYCMRKVLFERLGVPHVVTESDARKQRVFTAGHIFHEWIQKLTRDAGLSIAQEVELQDEDLMVRGHFDDLVLVDGTLMLIDYKTVNSRSFMWARRQVKETGENPMSYFHRLQLGTYMYMLRKQGVLFYEINHDVSTLNESRILKLEKDTLQMAEQQLLWSDELEADVLAYWNELNHWWKVKKLPKCTCADHEGGFMAKDKYNPYYYRDEPCSLEWYKLWKKGDLPDVPRV